MATGLIEGYRIAKQIHIVGTIIDRHLQARQGIHVVNIYSYGEGGTPRGADALGIAYIFFNRFTPVLRQSRSHQKENDRINKSLSQFSASKSEYFYLLHSTTAFPATDYR